MSKFMMGCFLAAAMSIAVPAAAMADDAAAQPAGAQPAYEGQLPAGGAMHDKVAAIWWDSPVAIGAGVAAAALLIVLLTNNGSNSSTTGTGN